MNNFIRTQKMISKEGFLKLQNSHVLICGLGGVGGMAFLSLVRMGIKNFTIVDFDTFDISNLNRQMLSNVNNVGVSKVVDAKRQALLINPEANIITKEIKISKESMQQLDGKYDYVVDCIDDLNGKVLLIKQFKNIISSMGTAMKYDPTKLKVAKLNQTSVDPLAKKLRFLLKDNKELLQTKVIFSTEDVDLRLKKIREEVGYLPSNVFVPNACGLLLASEVINTLVEFKL